MQNNLTPMVIECSQPSLLFSQNAIYSFQHEATPPTDRIKTACRGYFYLYSQIVFHPPFSHTRKRPCSHKICCFVFLKKRSVYFFAQSFNIPKIDPYMPFPASAFSCSKIYLIPLNALARSTAYKFFCHWHIFEYLSQPV